MPGGDLAFILGPAFMAGAVVALTHVPLGMEVLRRGIIFIDLAVAQIAALGVITAGLVFHLHDPLLMTLTATAFALAAGGIFHRAQRLNARYQEAVIGGAFVMAASLGILLLSANPDGGRQMEDLLAGQILWADWATIMASGVVSAGLLALWLGLRSRFPGLFYLIFPPLVTLSVQLVGVYMVFASLILPALGTAAIRNMRHRLAVGYIIAAIALSSGLWIGYLQDLPAGPVIVCSYGLVGCIAASITAMVIRKNRIRVQKF